MATDLKSNSHSDAHHQTHSVTIGTRSSQLALVQTESVGQALQQAWPGQQYAVHSMRTLGDRDKVTPLPDFNAKSLWTHDLEMLLLDGTLDMIVHSLKGTYLYNLSNPVQPPLETTFYFVFQSTIHF